MQTIWEGHTGTTSACVENTSAVVCRGEPWRNYLRMRGEYQPSGVSVT